MDIAKLGEFIEKWCVAGYPYLSSDERADAERLFFKIDKMARQGDMSARESMEFWGQKIKRPQLIDFDLKEHFSKLINYVDLDERQQALFEEKLNRADVYSSVPIERLFHPTSRFPSVDKETATKYQERVNGILERFIEAKGTPNELLNDVVKSNPVIFYFDTLPQEDAGMTSIFIDGKVRPFMHIVGGMMNADKVSDDYLATTMAHELGHWIDFVHRPADYFGKEKHWQEYYADVFGYQLAKNAGYDAQEFVTKQAEFAKENREWLVKQGRQVPDKTIFEERVELLQNMFGQDNQCKGLSLMQMQSFKKSR